MSSLLLEVSRNDIVYLDLLYILSDYSPSSNCSSFNQVEGLNAILDHHHDFVSLGADLCPPTVGTRETFGKSNAVPCDPFARATLSQSRLRLGLIKV